MKYLILGGGASALSIANLFKINGINDFLVLEAESEAGGLCRSKIVDGSALDIGGGHFLDADNKEVCDFVFKYMPKDEWNLFHRNSKIKLHDTYIDHPLEANIWQLPIENQIEYLKSIAIAGCNIGEDKPEKFVDWIYWKFGEKIANDYMLPYNKKIFDDNLNELGTYWLEKLPNVSFDETLMSCINKKPYGKEPGHTNFYYPKKYGYGELWLRLAKEIDKNIIYNEKVIKLDIEKKLVETEIGNKYEAEQIITTIPWTSIEQIDGLPNEIKSTIKSLKHSSVVIEYFNSKLESDAHWIYEPDENLSYHRILVRHNFCNNSVGYWTETNSNRYVSSDRINFYNEYAYPLNTIDKPIIMKNLLQYLESKSVFAFGRWGEHQHYNSDKVVSLAFKLFDKIISI